MSYFSNGKIYIIVDDVDINEEMINNTKRDFNSNSSTLRKTIPSAPTAQTLFKIKMPISAAFNRYNLFNHKDILREMEKSEWRET